MEGMTIAMYSINLLYIIRSKLRTQSAALAQLTKTNQTRNSQNAPTDHLQPEQEKPQLNNPQKSFLKKIPKIVLELYLGTLSDRKDAEKAKIHQLYTVFPRKIPTKFLKEDQLKKIPSQGFSKREIYLYKSTNKYFLSGVSQNILFPSAKNEIGKVAQQSCTFFNFPSSDQHPARNYERQARASREWKSEGNEADGEEQRILFW